MDAFIQKIGIRLAFDFLCFALLVPFLVIVLDKSLFGSHTEKALRLALLFYFALVTLLTLELFC